MNPTKQHVVPCFYLRGFTHGREKNSELFELDLNSRRQERSTPKKSGRIADFYVGNFSPKVDPYFVEHTFGKLESRWAPVIKKVLDTSTLPNAASVEFADIVSFVAFQTIRVPSMRTHINAIFHTVTRKQMLASLECEAGWKKFLRHMASIGEPVFVRREELRNSVLLDEHRFHLDQTSTIQEQLRAVWPLSLHLLRREWSLFRAAEQSSDFICSDSPVSVTDSTGKCSLEIGFCQPRSVVTIPLGRRHALAGFFEGNADLTLDERDVAGLNAMTIHEATKAFSAREDFKWLALDGTIRSSSDFTS